MTRWKRRWWLVFSSNEAGFNWATNTACRRYCSAPDGLQHCTYAELLPALGPQTVTGLARLRCLLCGRPEVYLAGLHRWGSAYDKILKPFISWPFQVFRAYKHSSWNKRTSSLWMQGSTVFPARVCLLRCFIWLNRRMILLGQSLGVKFIGWHLLCWSFTNLDSSLCVSGLIPILLGLPVSPTKTSTCSQKARNHFVPARPSLYSAHHLHKPSAGTHQQYTR